MRPSLSAQRAKVVSETSAFRRTFMLMAGVKQIRGCALRFESGGWLRRNRRELDVEGLAPAIPGDLDPHVCARIDPDDDAARVLRMRDRLFANAHDDVARNDS